MTEIFCCEDLLLTLKDPETFAAGVIRQLYLTSRMMGSAGSTGIMQRGDLAEDLSAKIICYDPQAKAFEVTRNGQPPHPPELVPESDIAAVLRSFVRDNSSIVPVYLTISDTLVSEGKETIRHVITGREIELNPPTNIPLNAHQLEPAISGMTVIFIVLVLIAIVFIYFRYFRVRKPPSELPDTRPYFVERNRNKKQVREALKRVRGE